MINKISEEGRVRATQKASEYIDSMVNDDKKLGYQLDDRDIQKAKDEATKVFLKFEKLNSQI